MSDAAISLDDVWVHYQLRHAHHYNLKRAAANRLRGRKEVGDTIVALAGVSIDVQAGSRLGLLGPNGAGKSTMLAVMARVLTPTRGTARTQGRVLALLGGPNEGLDPEATGRENAVQLGVKLGETSKRMERRLDDIIDFSGLGARIDHPVYSYSSGMQVRLRFSTITSLRADVLLVDEGIGAADAEFNARASGRMEEFLTRSGTLVLSSHDQGLVSRLCTSSVWLREGRFHTPAVSE
ncbi:MAG: ABC transporter ATP-binding protein [Candidatus Nanopelagicales bacterium]